MCDQLTSPEGSHKICFVLLLFNAIEYVSVEQNDFSNPASILWSLFPKL